MRVRLAPGGASTERWPLQNLAMAQAVTAPDRAPDDLFERTAWLYAFFRQHLFRDDTARIEAALWPGGAPQDGSLLLEIGCGPGVYTRQLADRHPSLRAVGIDRSPGLLRRAEQLAERDGVQNCWFEEGDALTLDWPDASADAVVASRLFTVVGGAGALAEMYRVLRPGGRCFIAEPAALLDTLAPMAALRLAGWLTSTGGLAGGERETAPWPRRLSPGEFAALIGSQPWDDVTVWQERGYHYAVCQKPTEGAS